MLCAHNDRFSKICEVHTERMKPRVQQPCKFIGTKESVYIRKELKTVSQDWFSTVTTWPPFHCDHQYGCHALQWCEALRLRANVEKYWAKRGDSKNLTNLCFECIERYLKVFKGFGVLFSKYGLLAGIFGKMDFGLSLAKKWPSKLAKIALHKSPRVNS